MELERRFAISTLLIGTLLAQPGTGWQISVPTNQILAPAGRRIEFPSRITDIAASPSMNTIAVVTQNEVAFFDLGGNKVSGVPLGQPPSMKGAAFNRDGTLLAVSRSDGCVLLVDVPKSVQKGCLGVPAGSLPAGVVFDKSGQSLFVALNRANSVVKLDLGSGKIVSTALVGVAPLGLALTPDGTRLFVSNQGGPLANAGLTAGSSGTAVSVDSDGIASAGSVDAIDTTSFRSLAQIPVGLHPGGIAVSPDGSTVAVANANSDSVSAIDAHALTVTTTVSVPSQPFGMRGASPTDVAFSADGTSLYVTLGGANSVAFFGVHSGAFVQRGVAGTDWYPVALAVLRGSYGEDSLFVGNSKGTGSRRSGNTFSVHDFTGTVNVINGGSAGHGGKGRVDPRVAPTAHPPSRPPLDSHLDLHSLGVRHVFLIVKENRTYDQVLGDIPAGNGQPNLTIYGEHVTPNQHNLARQFVLFDNYYASGTVSADGHQWITQAMATDYAERQYNASWPRSYPYSGEDPLIFASTGFIWSNALRHGLTARIFGEFSLQSGNYTGSWNDFLKASVAGAQLLSTPSVSSVASMSQLHAHDYPAFNLTVPDSYRARLVIDQLREWETKGSAPNLVIIQLPTDHTMGVTPGAPTPQAMVADNDWATARIVEAISHSSLWSKSAIFVTEDDSQDGVDHVDGHRTTCYIASPFARRGMVDPGSYNHTSIVRTIEDLLGLPTMNRFDATATPMRNAFTGKPDLTPFSAVPPNIRLDETTPPLNALHGPAWKAAKASLAMNFRVPDAAPEMKLNRILWQEAKGWNVSYPKPAHKKTCPKDRD